MKEVCAYIRVSTDKQEELSPESQLRLIRDYAASHDMLLTKIYREDHGISGKNSDKRPAFQEMIASCKDKSHPFDAILVWKFSRFARNIDESTYYKSVLRKKCDVDVISISEPIMPGMYGRLIEMVIEWSDEFYLYNLSGEVMRGMTQKAMQGGYNSNAPIGYEKKKGEIPKVNPEEAAIVTKIFDMFVNQNESRADIASKLNQSNIKTRRGNRWDSRAVTYILENPFYIGKIRWNYFDRSKNSRKSPDDVIISDGKHEPIISQEMFVDAARLIAKERQIRGGYGQKRNVAAVKHWLSGIVKCSSCGASLGYCKGSEKKSTPPFFQCWKHTKGACDMNAYVSAKNLEQLVISTVRSFSKGKTFYFDPKKVEVKSEESTWIERELSGLSKKEKRIKEAYINGIDSLEEYRENKTMIARKREELEAKLSTAEEERPVGISEINKPIDMDGLIRLLEDGTADYEAKGKAIREIFDHFVYHRDTQSLDCHLNEGILVDTPF